jgi:hypothetical protein
MVEIDDQHIVSELRYLLRLEDSARIHHIEKDNWIGYPKAKQALTKLINLCSHPKRQRMPNLLLIGRTNNGKSMIIEKFCRNYSPVRTTEIQYIGIKKIENELLVEMPILSIQMPSLPDMRQFYYELADKIRLAGGVRRIIYQAYTDSSFVKLIEEYKVKMLIIDEIHNLLAGRNDKQHIFLNTLRYIGNTARIPIVCVGTKDAYMAIRSDPQLENRFEPFVLSSWKAGTDYDSLLASIASILPLKRASNLNQSKISCYILEKTDGILGEIFTLIRRAAQLAIETGHETISEEILHQVDYYSPTERIKLFEHSVVA